MRRVRLAAGPEVRAVPGVPDRGVDTLARGTGGGGLEAGREAEAMIASVDLDARRIASAERHYTRVRRQIQSGARKAWLESAVEFRRVTKELICGCDADTRERVNEVLSQLAPARNVVRRITGCLVDEGVGLRP